MPLQIAAALAVKKIMERSSLPGTLKLWPGVAEELLGTKAYYVRAGAFKDVDVVLFAHVGSNMGVGWGDGSGNGLVSVEYTFKGESAHAAGAPWRGRSALDAVELMNIGWNFRREHLRIQQRSHYVITNGGDQPNVVPPNAVGLVLLPRDRLRRTSRRCGRSATRWRKARGDDDRHRASPSRVLGSAWPRHFNKTVAETMHANIETVGLPQWTEADQTLAKALQTRAEGARSRAGDEAPAAARPRGDARRGEARRRLGRHRRHLVERADRHAALPGEHRRPAPATTGRTRSRWRRRSRTKASSTARRSMALTVLDLLMRPELVTQAWDYFKNVQTKDTKYMPLIRPEDKPAIWLNEQIMAKYRPEMKKFYYDPIEVQVVPRAARDQVSDGADDETVRAVGRAAR